MSGAWPLRLLALGLAITGAGCFDPQSLGELVFGVDEADVWKDGGRRPTPAVVGERRLLVTNSLDDTVSVVSYERLLQGQEGAELSRFPVGLSPSSARAPTTSTSTARAASPTSASRTSSPAAALAPTASTAAAPPTGAPCASTSTPSAPSTSPASTRTLGTFA